MLTIYHYTEAFASDFSVGMLGARRRVLEEE